MQAELGQITGAYYYGTCRHRYVCASQQAVPVPMCGRISSSQHKHGTHSPRTAEDQKLPTRENPAASGEDGRYLPIWPQMHGTYKERLKELGLDFRGEEASVVDPKKFSFGSESEFAGSFGCDLNSQ